MDRDLFILVFRVVALVIVGSWLVHIAVAVRKPPDWRPPKGPRAWLAPMTRNQYIGAALLGVLAGLGLIAYSFTL